MDRLAGKKRCDPLHAQRRPYKSLEDIRKATTPPKCGSTGTAGTDYILGPLEDTLHLKITTVMGIQRHDELGGGKGRGAMPRSSDRRPFFGREPFISHTEKNFVNVLVFGGQRRETDRIPDTPTIYEIFDKEAGRSRRVADVILRGRDSVARGLRLRGRRRTASKYCAART